MVFKVQAGHILEIPEMVFIFLRMSMSKLKTIYKLPRYSHVYWDTLDNPLNQSEVYIEFVKRIVYSMSYSRYLPLCSFAELFIFVQLCGAIYPCVALRSYLSLYSQISRYLYLAIQGQISLSGYTELDIFVWLY